MTPRILVIDGEQEIRDLIVSGLTGEGYEVIAAATGEEGLDAARSEKPNLICMEVALADADGFETAKQVLTDPVTRDIPLVFLTSRAGLKDRVEGLRLGAHAYMTKPFAFPELFATLDGILQRAPAAESVEPAESHAVAIGMGMMGSLGAIGITTVIQAIEGEAQSGILRVVSGTNWGELAFHKGKIIGAAAGRLTGEKAIFELVGWDSGTYTFRAEATEPAPPIAESATSVLMRAFQHHDERRAAP